MDFGSTFLTRIKLMRYIDTTQDLQAYGIVASHSYLSWSIILQLPLYFSHVALLINSKNQTYFIIGYIFTYILSTFLSTG